MTKTKKHKTYPQLPHDEALEIGIRAGLKEVRSELTGEWLVPSSEIVRWATWHARFNYDFHRTGGLRFQGAVRDFGAVDAAVREALAAKGVQS